MTQTPGPRGGFTFVELLIAATMMSVLLIGLGGHLRGGLLIWQQTTQVVEALQRDRVAFERFERDLANAVVYDDPRQDVPLSGVAFGTTELRWFTVQHRAHQRDAIRVVTYRCEPVGNTPGLWRTSQSVGEARAGLEPRRELVLPGCDALHIRYAYAPAEGGGTFEWRDEWRYPKELPQLIEVTTRHASGRDVRRLMALPQGSLKPAEKPS